VGPRNHILDGVPDSPIGWGNFGVGPKSLGAFAAVYAKQLKRSRCRLEADSGKLKEPCVRWGSRSLKENGNFGGCPAYSKALTVAVYRAHFASVGGF